MVWTGLTKFTGLKARFIKQLHCRIGRILLEYLLDSDARGGYHLS